MEHADLLWRVVHPTGTEHDAGPPLLPETTAVSQEAPPRNPEYPMPARWPKPHAALIATLLPLLASCGPARDQFAPACPRPMFLADAADLNIYRSGSAAGVHDLSDLVLHSRIVGVNGSCQEGNTKDRLATVVNVGVELTRGPAMQGRETDVPVFIAVTDGEAILDKRVYLMHATFPSNVDRVTLGTGDVDLALPVSATKSGAAYTILTGFQLTADQLEQNRQNRRQ
jgi:hypothetical protein